MSIISPKNESVPQNQSIFLPLYSLKSKPAILESFEKMQRVNHLFQRSLQIPLDLRSVGYEEAQHIYTYSLQNLERIKQTLATLNSYDDGSDKDIQLKLEDLKKTLSGQIGALETRTKTLGFMPLLKDWYIDELTQLKELETALASGMSKIQRPSNGCFIWTANAAGIQEASGCCSSLLAHFNAVQTHLSCWDKNSTPIVKRRFDRTIYRMNRTMTEQDPLLMSILANEQAILRNKSNDITKTKAALVYFTIFQQESTKCSLPALRADFLDKIQKTYTEGTTRFSILAPRTDVAQVRKNIAQFKQGAATVKKAMEQYLKYSAENPDFTRTQSFQTVQTDLHKKEMIAQVKSIKNLEIFLEHLTLIQLAQELFPMIHQALCNPDLKDKDLQAIVVRLKKHKALITRHNQKFMTYLCEHIVCEREKMHQKMKDPDALEAWYDLDSAVRQTEACSQYTNNANRFFDYLNVEKFEGIAFFNIHKRTLDKIEKNISRDIKAYKFAKEELFPLFEAHAVTQIIDKFSECIRLGFSRRSLAFFCHSFGLARIAKEGLDLGIDFEKNGHSLKGIPYATKLPEYVANFGLIFQALAYKDLIPAEIANEYQAKYQQASFGLSEKLIELFSPKKDDKKAAEKREIGKADPRPL